MPAVFRRASIWQKGHDAAVRCQPAAIPANPLISSMPAEAESFMNDRPRGSAPLPWLYGLIRRRMLLTTAGDGADGVCASYPSQRSIGDFQLPGTWLPAFWVVMARFRSLVLHGKPWAPCGTDCSLDSRADRQQSPCIRIGVVCTTHGVLSPAGMTSAGAT